MANLHFGNRVRLAREALNIPREEFAREVGTSTSTIARLELDGKEPKLETVLSIARRLDMSVDHLTARESDAAAR